jgi:hypothetical protein
MTDGTQNPYAPPTTLTPTTTEVGFDIVRDYNGIIKAAHAKKNSSLLCRFLVNLDKESPNAVIHFMQRLTGRTPEVWPTGLQNYNTSIITEHMPERKRHDPKARIDETKIYNKTCIELTDLSNTYTRRQLTNATGLAISGLLTGSLFIHARELTTQANAAASRGNELASELASDLGGVSSLVYGLGLAGIALTLTVVYTMVHSGIDQSRRKNLKELKPDEYGDGSIKNFERFAQACDKKLIEKMGKYVDQPEIGPLR